LKGPDFPDSVDLKTYFQASATSLRIFSALAAAGDPEAGASEGSIFAMT
jgi:hypothetical protein